MKKQEVIKRYGKTKWQRRLAHHRAYYKVHKEEENARSKKWREVHPEEVIASNMRFHQEACRKGGRYYDRKLAYLQTGLQGERHKIRGKHGKRWYQYKRIIAPGSQLHHPWKHNFAEYNGVALVEADAHMHGIIDVFEILEGAITLFTEKEIREQGESGNAF